MARAPATMRRAPTLPAAPGARAMAMAMVVMVVMVVVMVAMVGGAAATEVYRSAVSAAACDPAAQGSANATAAGKQLPCCAGLTCPFSGGVCCEGATSCCPAGAQCTADKPPRCHARVLVLPAAGGGGSNGSAQAAAKSEASSPSAPAVAIAGDVAPAVPAAAAAKQEKDAEGARIREAVRGVGQWNDDFSKRVFERPASLSSSSSGTTVASTSSSSKPASGVDGTSATVDKATAGLSRWMKNLRQRMVDDNNVARLTGSSRDSQVGVTPDLMADEGLTYQSVMSQLQSAMAGDGMIKDCRCPPAPKCCAPAPEVAPPPRPACCAPLPPCNCAPTPASGSSNSSRQYPNGCTCPERAAGSKCACEVLAVAPEEKLGVAANETNSLIRDIEPPLPGEESSAAKPATAAAASAAAPASSSASSASSASSSSSSAAPAASGLPTDLSMVTPAAAASVAQANAAAAAVAAASSSQTASAVTAPASSGDVNFSTFDMPENAPNQEPFALEASAPVANSTAAAPASSSSAQGAAAAAAPSLEESQLHPARRDDDDDKTDDGAAGPAESAAAAAGSSSSSSSSNPDAAGPAPGGSPEGVVVNVVVQPPTEDSGAMDLSSGAGAAPTNEADAREAQFDARAEAQAEARGREADQLAKRNRSRQQYCLGRTAAGELRMVVRGPAGDGGCDGAFDSLGAAKGTFAAYANLWSFSEQVAGTSPLCVRSASTGAWRSELVWGASCTGGDWQQDYVTYVMRGGHPGAVPYCVKASVDQSRPLRQYVEVGRTQCGSDYWRQVFVFWAYPTFDAAGVNDTAAAAAAVNGTVPAQQSSDTNVPSTVTPVVKFREVRPAPGDVPRDSTFDRVLAPATAFDPAASAEHLERMRRIQRLAELRRSRRDHTGGAY